MSTFESDVASEAPHAPDACQQAGEVVVLRQRGEVDEGRLWLGLQVLGDPFPVGLEVLRRLQCITVDEVGVSDLGRRLTAFWNHYHLEGMVVFCGVNIYALYVTQSILFLRWHVRRLSVIEYL